MVLSVAPLVGLIIEALVIVGAGVGEGVAVPPVEPPVDPPLEVPPLVPSFVVEKSVTQYHLYVEFAL